jgi:hypothetical protein
VDFGWFLVLGFGGKPTLPTVVSKHHAKVRVQEEVDSYRDLAGKKYMDGLHR